MENDYNQYLTAHSGYSNAYTASTETNYFFEVAASAEDAGGSKAQTNGTATSAVPATNGTKTVELTSDLESDKSSSSPLYGALDRFSQFFIAPLFLEETLDRELRAVDSENKKNLQSDNWRMMQLDKSLSTKKHPYHHFSTGNLVTLRDEPRARGVEIRSEFMKFHDKHYSANRMKLVVLGKEPLDTLQSWVEELFSGVDDKNLPPLRWTESGPYAEEDLLKIIFAKPVMESRSMDIVFTYQDEEENDLYRSRPSRYISHLVGHEGPGSILAHIKAKGWANALSVGSSRISPGFAQMHINVRLTPDGLEKYEEITKIIFQYIALIKTAGPQKWIFDELKNMSEVDFRFREKSPATRFTSNASSTMQKSLPRELLLSGESVVREYNPKGIEQGLSWLRPDNYRLQITSQDYPGNWNQKEKWYGTEYRIEDISSQLRETLKKALESTAEEIPKELHLPHKNDFVPTKLTVERKQVEEPTKAPKLIRNDDAIRLWWKKDDHFWVPKASLKALLRTPLVSITPENTVKAAMYTMLVSDELNEYSYDAEIAGLEWDLDDSTRGLHISISGYNEKMPVLLEKVLMCMKNIVIKPDRFEIIKERLLRAYRNWEFAQPYQHSGTYVQWLRSTVSWTNDQLLLEVSHITPEDITNFYPQLLKQLHIEVLAHGNLYKEDALRMTKMVETIIQPRSLPRTQWQKKRNLILPENSDHSWKRVHQDPAVVNNAIDYFLYVGDIGDRVLRAKLLLLGQIGSEPAFDQLRTKEQLGYIVWSGARYGATTMGYRVTIQSERSAEYLEQRINAFLMVLLKNIEDMSAKEFDSHKRSIINTRLEKLKNLDSEFSRFNCHISDEYYNFLQAEEDAESVRPITKEQMLEFFNHYIHPTSPKRAKLSVHIIAQSSPKDAGAALSKEDRVDMMVNTMDKSMLAAGMEVKPEKLRARLAGFDMVGSDKKGLIATVLKYLEEDIKVPDGQHEAIAGAAAQLLATVLSADDVDAQQSGEKGLPISPKVKETTWIENVPEFKASLQASVAPIPVVDLSTFEELEAKL